MEGHPEAVARVRGEAPRHGNQQRGDAVQGLPARGPVPVEGRERRGHGVALAAVRDGLPAASGLARGVPQHLREDSALEAQAEHQDLRPRGVVLPPPLALLAPGVGVLTGAAPGPLLDLPDPHAHVPARLGEVPREGEDGLHLPHRHDELPFHFVLPRRDKGQRSLVPRVQAGNDAECPEAVCLCLTVAALALPLSPPHELGRNGPAILHIGAHLQPQQVQPPVRLYLPCRRR
mmetsp:Transcript_18888/g.59292  ORF Transcript_18888/g.59292 Transcript_18888/m.59292 type:complete len:233 (-) Transcript_18888:589-1287(-)